MKEYALYVESLNTLIDDIVSDPFLYGDKQEIVAHTLDGAAAEALRQTISLEKLREHGAFFTSSSLAHRAIEPIAQTISQDAVIYDPACGAGDLLIACTEYLPITNELETTLKMWGKMLGGHDIFSNFIAATKARLVLAAIQRGVPFSKDYELDLDKIFPLITVENSLQNFEAIKNATHIATNPPFIRIQAPKKCRWSNGKVNSAALFMEKYLTGAAPGTKIIAILPDVLRSGTNYKKWRELVESHTAEKYVDLYGQFDKWADVG